MIKYTLCGRVGGVCGRRAAAARAGLWRPRCRFVADGGRQDVAARRAVLSQEIGRLRALLSHTSDDLSFIHAESVREHIDAIRRELKDRTDESVADIAGRMAEGAATYHETLVKYVDNRDLYNQAAQTKVTNDSNIKYGIVGVSLMCVFGSLALSLHPVFLFGCAVGGYIYRPVFRQSRMKEERTVSMEKCLQDSKNYKQQMVRLQREMVELLSELEKKVDQNGAVKPT